MQRAISEAIVSGTCGEALTRRAVVAASLGAASRDLTDQHGGFRRGEASKLATCEATVRRYLAAHPRGEIELLIHLRVLVKLGLGEDQPGERALEDINAERPVVMGGGVAPLPKFERRQHLEHVVLRRRK